MKKNKLKKYETINFVIAKERLLMNLSEIDNLIKFESAIVKIAKDALFEIARSLKSRKLLDADVNQKLNQAHGKISGIYNGAKNENDDLVTFKQLISHSLVFIISNLESFLKEIFVLFVDTHYESLNIDSSIAWKELKDLKFNAGEILLSTHKASDFQDLQAIYRIFENDLGISLAKIINTREKDKLILAYAIRHIIIHKNAKVDEKFLAQLKNTEYAKSYQLGEEININIFEIKDFKYIVEKFANSLLKRVEAEFINRYTTEVFDKNN